MAVDFTKLAQPISNALDTDFMDIKRQIEGSPERDLIYSNIPCHIAIKTSDNPDPDSVDVQPIITSLRIHTVNWVDLKNNDYVIAKKCDLQGNVLNFYEGIVGEPATSMARQSVTLAMQSADKGDKPEPVPTPEVETVNVVISYLNSSNEPIHNGITQAYRVGDTVTIKALNIDNYTPVRAVLDDSEVGIDTVTIVDIQGEDYILKFYYQEITAITSIRMLVDGDYTKDNGTFATGLHLYAPISVLSANTTTLTLASNKFEHEDEGIITIKKDDKFRDNLNNWHIITAVSQVDNGYIITFEDTQPVNCYETHWYS